MAPQKRHQRWQLSWEHKEMLKVVLKMSFRFPIYWTRVHFINIPHELKVWRPEKVQRLLRNISQMNSMLRQGQHLCCNTCTSKSHSILIWKLPIPSLNHSGTCYPLTFSTFSRRNVPSVITRFWVQTQFWWLRHKMYVGTSIVLRECSISGFNAKSSPPFPCQ